MMKLEHGRHAGSGSGQAPHHRAPTSGAVDRDVALAGSIEPSPEYGAACSSDARRPDDRDIRPRRPADRDRAARRDVPPTT
jgi:hypothetical protein